MLLEINPHSTNVTKFGFDYCFLAVYFLLSVIVFLFGPRNRCADVVGTKGPGPVSIARRAAPSYCFTASTCAACRRVAFCTYVNIDRQSILQSKNRSAKYF